MTTTELKTLKDIQEYYYGDAPESVRSTFQTLRAEAIRWANNQEEIAAGFMDRNISLNGYLTAIGKRSIIMDFFNLSEDDMK